MLSSPNTTTYVIPPVSCSMLRLAFLLHVERVSDIGEIAIVFGLLYSNGGYLSLNPVNLIGLQIAIHLCFCQRLVLVIIQL